MALTTTTKTNAYASALAILSRHWINHIDVILLPVIISIVVVVISMRGFPAA